MTGQPLHTSTIWDQDVAMSDLVCRYGIFLKGGGYSPRTIESRISFLARVDTEHLPYGLDEASPDELGELLGTESWSDNTRSTYWSHLHGYYEWAVRKARELAFNPLDDLHRPAAGDDTPDPVTDDELALAIERSPDSPWRLAVRLAAYAGLRGSEIAAIHREHITEQRVHVVLGKGRRDRYVPTHEYLWDAVRYLRPGRLVLSSTGLPLTGHRLTSGQHRHWRSIGLPDVHLHRFRHWYATTLLLHGNDLRTVQELMGHRSIISTQAYTKVVSRQREQAIRSLPLPARAKGPDSH